MKMRTILTLILAGGLLAAPVDAAPASLSIAQASVKKVIKAKDGKKKAAKDKKKGKKGKKGKIAAAYKSPSSGAALCADGADLFSAPMVNGAEETKLTGALYDPDILAENAELALMMQGQGHNPMIDVHLERINNELRAKLAKAYLARRCKSEPGDTTVLSHQVAIISADTIMPAEDLAELISSEKLVWSPPASIHSMAAKGAALQVVYKVGDSFINTLLLSDDLKTVYGVGETISATEPVPASGYNPIPVK